MTTIKIIFKILFLVLIASNLNSLSLTDANKIDNIQDTAAKRSISQDDQVQTVPDTTSSKQDDEIAELVAGPNGLTSLINGGPSTSTTSTTKSPTVINIEDEINSSELCYLSDGGSSVTLIVNEATQVGSVIGQVEVNGEPALDSSGNIDLLDGASAEPATNSTSQQSDNFLSAAASTTTTTSTTTTSANNNNNNLHQYGGLAHSALTRQQHRRLLGRRSAPSSSSLSAEQGNHHTQQRPPRIVGPPPPATSFYSLIASSSATQPSSDDYYTNRQLATPVRLEPGTKNLILARQLDKESAEGESSLLVNVKCRPRHRGSSFTVIPIRLLITDANDHAPEFIFPPGPPNNHLRPMYVINISETAPVGSIATREIQAIDKDSTGPHSTIHYKVLESATVATATDQVTLVPPAELANLFAFTNPLEPTLFVAAPLDFETQPQTFTLTILAQDQAEPEPLSSTAQVQVNLIDFDDQNPKFLDEKYSLLMDESQANSVGQNLRVSPRSLRAEDGDRGIMSPILYSFDLQQQQQLQSPESQVAGPGQDGSSVAANESPLTNIERYLHLNPSTGELRLIKQWPTSGRLSMTLVVRATQVDNKDRYSLTTLTITSGPGEPINQHPPRLTSLERQKKPAGQQKVGLAFVQDRLTISLPEDTPTMEKVARVRANYIGSPEQAGEPATIEQAVDLVAAAAAATGSNKTTAGTNNAARQQSRPINYQILDDQTDSFGINGLGELSLKRPLDFEQRQQFKFRILATYTKYSDICQVQVNVVNVNDNKPKYTFHVNEARLRSNLIGQVQAHDADLNDTLRYSITSTACQPAALAGTPAANSSHLFEINSAGQLSLRPGTRQLNFSSCQLIVQVQDSLNSKSPTTTNTHQTKIILHIAPQILGRSINFDAQPTTVSASTSHSLITSATTLANSIADDQQPGQNKWLISGNSASEVLGLASSKTLAVGKQHQAHQPPVVVVNNQRSSLATVMSSLQHMVKSVNFFEMPMSSALLLSALLAFMVCLLFIVIISMSVHVYKRRSKWRRRRHLAATAHLRHAHLAAALAPATSRHLTTGPGMGVGAGEQSPRVSGGSPTSSSSGSSPTTCGTTASGQPVQRQLAGSPVDVGASGDNRKASPEQPNQAPVLGSLQQRIVESSAMQGKASGRFRDQLLMTDTTGTGGGGGLNQSSLISSLSSRHSNNRLSSYKLDSSLTTTATSDDSSSSVMNCGHYSVNGTMQSRQVARRSPASDSKLASGAKRKTPVGSPTGNGSLGEPRTSIEAAIRSLVRQPEGDETDTNYHEEKQANSKTTNASKVDDELSILTAGKPGIKSYRRLPLMNSLVRPVKSQLMMIQSNGLANNKVGPMSSMDMANQWPQQSIRWPSEATPQRVKKLTWDDELSCNTTNLNNYEDDQVRSRMYSNNNEDNLNELQDQDCYISPDVGLHESPTGVGHIYYTQSTSQSRVNSATGHVNISPANQYEPKQQQQLFLFSASANCTPISPQLNGNYNNHHHQYNLSPTNFNHEPDGRQATEPTGDMSAAAAAQHLEAQHENNCLDYTIIQNSQFQVDSLQARQRRQQQVSSANSTSNSYCYHNSSLNEFNVNELKRIRMNNNQNDLTNLTSSMTTAVL